MTESKSPFAQTSDGFPVSTMLQEAMRDAKPSITRTSSLALDRLLGVVLPVGVNDEMGKIAVVDYLGDQQTIVKSARVSYNADGKDRTHAEDVGLIRYLMSHRHTSPFEMCEITFDVTLPIFVARQWVRHRTANINEVSARYSLLDFGYFTPHPETLCTQSSSNKQGRGEPFDTGEQAELVKFLDDASGHGMACYAMMGGAHGVAPSTPGKSVARETARMVLPLSTFTRWIWKIDLHNLLHFLGLRLDPHAQLEIRVFAGTIAEIVRQWVPDVMQAFMDYRMNAITLSAQELEALWSLFIGLWWDRDNPNYRTSLLLREIVSAMDGMSMSEREKGRLLGKLKKAYGPEGSAIPARYRDLLLARKD